MTQPLFNRTGQRKYLVSCERLAFVRAAVGENDAIASFCLTLALTGARISEALALTGERVDLVDRVLVFDTLKRRRRGVFRAVPVPHILLELIERGCRRARTEQRIWPWGRTTAWKHVRRVMRQAGIVEGLCTPRALRHGFAVEAGLQSVPLNIVQRWLGHARIETTAIYSGVLGEEERTLANKTWKPLEVEISSVGKSDRLS